MSGGIMSVSLEARPVFKAWLLKGFTGNRHAAVVTLSPLNKLLKNHLKTAKTEEGKIKMNRKRRNFKKASKAVNRKNSQKKMKLHRKKR